MMVKYIDVKYIAKTEFYDRFSEMLPTSSFLGD